MPGDDWVTRTYGYANWAEARRAMTRRLHAVARSQSKITYSDLCAALRDANVIDLDPHGTPLAAMLGQINILEAQSGRPMISSVVVHKTGDYFPGVGFWNVAKEMGIEIGDTEDERVAYWGPRVQQVPRLLEGSILRLGRRTNWRAYWRAATDSADSPCKW